MSAPPVDPHRLVLSRRKLGQADWGTHGGAAGMSYGTVGRCTCGWEAKINEAPSKGGNRRVEALHALHINQARVKVER